MMNEALYIGLMSGTSLDGIDAALVSIPDSSTPTLLGHHYVPYSSNFRNLLATLCEAETLPAQLYAQLDIGLADLFATAVGQLLEKHDLSPKNIQAIGSHGQTIRHLPDQQFTLQIGDPNRIARQTGIATVADFRRMDMAAGGQGAPLVPAFHEAIFRHPECNRVIVNIGGIANITWLPRNPDCPIAGFDTGPGNGLMNQWITRNLGQDFDTGGDWARSGTLNEALLERMLSDPYFHRRPPKSTGREHFNLNWLEQQLDDSALAPEDIQNTLAHLTARSVTDHIQHHCQDVDEVMICGGGRRNDFLMELLRHYLPNTTVTTTDSAGIDGDWIEAMAFAWLARQRLHAQAGNCPAVTHAEFPVILGGLYLPPPITGR